MTTLMLRRLLLLPNENRPVVASSGIVCSFLSASFSFLSVLPLIWVPWPVVEPCQLYSNGLGWCLACPDDVTVDSFPRGRLQHCRCRVHGKSPKVECSCLLFRRAKFNIREATSSRCEEGNTWKLNQSPFPRPLLLVGTLVRREFWESHVLYFRAQIDDQNRWVRVTVWLESTSCLCQGEGTVNT